MEAVWLREALFAGMTANAFKLGTVLTLGWFWPRVTGCCLLYRGKSMEAIEFGRILAVAEAYALEISVPPWVAHDSESTYFYVVRVANGCGEAEQTLAAAVKVLIGADGDLAEPPPNRILEAKSRQVDGNRIQLVWYYSPIEQKSPPECFKVYCDAGTGQVDYENPVAVVGYTGRRFYSYRSDPLAAGSYLFCIRAEDIDGTEGGSVARLRTQLEVTSPDPIAILGIGAV